MHVLVIGATGTVGSQVVKELLARDVKVRILTRSEEKAKNIPAGAEAVVGKDLPDRVRERQHLSSRTYFRARAKLP